MEGEIVEVDTYMLDQLVYGLQSRERALEGNVVKIYGDINNLESGWTGESYNRFKELMNTYKDPLNSAAVCVGAFAELLKEVVVPAAQTYQEKVSAAVGYGVSRGGGGGYVATQK